MDWKLRSTHLVHPKSWCPLLFDRWKDVALNQVASQLYDYMFTFKSFKSRAIDSFNSLNRGTHAIDFGVNVLVLLFHQQLEVSCLLQLLWLNCLWIIIDFFLYLICCLNFMNVRQIHMGYLHHCDIQNFLLMETAYSQKNILWEEFQIYWFPKHWNLGFHLPTIIFLIILPLYKIAK